MVETKGIRGDRLERLRRGQNLTQGQVSLRSGVNQSLISRLERGIRSNVYVDTASALARALNTTTDYLLGLTPNPWPPQARTSPETQLEWQLLDAFRKLSQDEQRYIIAQIDWMHNLLNRPPFRVIGGTDDEAQETGSAERPDPAQTGT